MRKKRIIPLLDIKEGRVVKGVKFEDVRDVGDPLAMAEAYCKAGADELILLDITATTEDRPLMLEVIRNEELEYRDVMMSYSMEMRKSVGRNAAHP